MTRPIDLIVAGCPRSGTTYAAVLLSAMGIRCTHEKYFNPNRMTLCPREPVSEPYGESSPAAIGAIREAPKGTRTLHVVREPVACVRSMLYTGHVTWSSHAPPHTTYPRALAWEKEYHRRTASFGPWPYHRHEVALEFWRRYNIAIERACKGRAQPYRRINVERPDSSTLYHLLNGLGIDITLDRVCHTIANTGRQINSLRKSPRDPLPVLDWQLTDAQRELATRYEYPEHAE